MTCLQRPMPEKTAINLIDFNWISYATNCGAIGEARVSGNEGPVFRVDGCRERFSAIRPSADYRGAMQLRPRVFSLITPSNYGDGFLGYSVRQFGAEAICAVTQCEIASGQLALSGS
jgi:hypothetical protein